MCPTRKKNFIKFFQVSIKIHDFSLGKWLNLMKMIKMKFRVLHRGVLELESPVRAYIDAWNWKGSIGHNSTCKTIRDTSFCLLSIDITPHVRIHEPMNGLVVLYMYRREDDDDDDIIRDGAEDSKLSEWRTINNHPYPGFASSVINEISLIRPRQLQQGFGWRCTLACKKWRQSCGFVFKKKSAASEFVVSVQTTAYD